MKTFITATFSILGIGLFGQNQYYVDTEVSNNAPAANEQVRITYQLNFKGQGGSFNLSGLQVRRAVPEAFAIIDESAGMSMNWGFGDVGGDMALYKYTQVLKPKKQGSFTLAPVEFLWNGKTYKSEEVTIYVGEAPPESQRQESREYFMETSLSRENVYVGEQIIMTLRLYTQRDMRNITLTTQPEFRNFYRQELTANNRSTVASVGGKQYYTSELAKYVLTPIGAGEVRIDPYEAEAQAVIGRGFFADLKAVTLRSSTATVNVKSLPAAGKPASFSGAVGSFKMQPEISSEETPADEPITYRITISGEGDFNFVKDPVIDLPQDFEVYDPKVTASISANKTSGAKTFEYLIIPRRQGEYALKPYEFSWFDPKKERYFTASTPEYQINVTKGTGTTSSSSYSGISKEDVELLGEDIRYIKTDPLYVARGIAFGSKAFIALMIAPVLLFIPLLFVKRSRDRRLADQLVQQDRIASKQTRKNLATAKRLMAEGDVRGFYQSLQNALQGWLANRLNIPQGDLSKENIVVELSNRGVDDTLSNEMRSLLDTCEIALYAPSAQSGGMHESWKSANRVVEELQSALR